MKFVIEGMLIHNISLYSWPIAILEDLERNIRNFNWSNDIEKRKLVIVAWHKVCKPTNEGGLGIRSFINLNVAYNLNLFWDLMTSQEDWVVQLRSRAFHKNEPIKYYIFSSLWSSCKSKVDLVLDNIIRNLGNGSKINLWFDTWCGPLIASSLNLPAFISSYLTATVNDFIHNQKWYLPIPVQQFFSND